MKLQKHNTTAQAPSDIEKQILIKLSYGLNVSDIATDLGTEHSIVHDAVHDMISRYEFRNNCHLVATAIKQGWIE